ncbi:MAG: aminoglycoside phosphotransferase family protein [Vulcanimicrobiaceae bacterium]
MISKPLAERVARMALRTTSAHAVRYEIEAIPCRVINHVTRALQSLSGIACVDGEHRPWKAFRKIIGAPGSEAEHAGRFVASSDPVHWNYWRREALFYTSSFSDTLPTGLRVPQCYAIDDCGERISLFLEFLHGEPARQWPPHRHSALAAQLGAWAQRTLDMPSHLCEWMTRGFVRAWTPDEHSAAVNVLRDDRIWSSRLVQRSLGAFVRNRALRLLEHREELLDEIETGERILVHNDLWPANVFAGNEPEQCTIIDWSMFGIGGLSDDLANYVFDGGWMLVLPPDKLEQTARVMVERYVDALSSAGAHVQAQALRRFALVAALRFGLLAGVVANLSVDEIMQEEVERRYGMGFERVLAHRAAVVETALRMYEEAEDIALPGARGPA